MEKIELDKNQESNLISDLKYGFYENPINNEKKVTGGKNGYGAKLTNIFSKEFEVETVDLMRRKRFRQTFTNNMGNKTKAKVSSLKNPKDGYTKITFKPDLKRFGIETLTDDIVNLMVKRVYDVAATTDPSVIISYNKKKININNFKKYISMFYNDKSINKLGSYAREF